MAVAAWGSSGFLLPAPVPRAVPFGGSPWTLGLRPSQAPRMKAVHEDGDMLGVDTLPMPNETEEVESLETVLEGSQPWRATPASASTPPKVKRVLRYNEGAGLPLTERLRSFLSNIWKHVSPRTSWVGTRAAALAATTAAAARTGYGRARDTAQRRGPALKKRLQGWKDWTETTWTSTPGIIRRSFMAVVLILLLLLGSLAVKPPRFEAAQRSLQPSVLRALHLDELSRLKALEVAKPSVVYIAGQGPTDFEGGTGWILDDEGHVVTSLSTIDLTRRGSLRVYFHDLSDAPARVVGVDRGSDLALLEVRRPIDSRTFKLQPLRRAPSTQLQAGQDVFVVGNLAGVDHTISRGVIFSLGQPLVLHGGRPVQGAILTDALIYKGNAGGPLLNGRGEVVGMAIATPGGAIPGVPVGGGAAVPIDSITARVKSILSHGHIRRPTLGLSLGPDGLAQRLGLRTGGVVIVEVERGGPAEQAGLRPGDVLTAIGDQRLRRTDDVVTALDLHEPGDSVRLLVQRPLTQQPGRILMPGLRYEEVEFIAELAPEELELEYYRGR